MDDKGQLEYRRGRLVLPEGIVDWPPGQVARWLSRVPLAERGRAFRALPLNVAAAGFLAMEPKYRVGLISALNPSNVRYLCGIARDEHLLETLELAGDDVQASLMQALPDWRRARIVEQLQQRVAAEKKGKDKDRGKRDRPDWLSRLVRVVRHKDR